MREGRRRREAEDHGGSVEDQDVGQCHSDAGRHRHRRGDVVVISIGRHVQKEVEKAPARRNQPGECGSHRLFFAGVDEGVFSPITSRLICIGPVWALKDIHENDNS